MAVWNLFNVSNKDNRKMSLTSFWRLYSSVSIAHFELNFFHSDIRSAAFPNIVALKISQQTQELILLS